MKLNWLMEEVFSAYVLRFLERKSNDNIYTLSAPPNNTESMLKKINFQASLT